MGGGLAAFRSQSRGFGGEHFIKHIADHMHTVKYPTSSGGTTTLQELGFRSGLLTQGVPGVPQDPFAPRRGPLGPSLSR
jgi:hypothetical protein